MTISKWNQVRDVIRKSITANMSQYPARYRFDAKLRLDRYDFDNQLYRFADRNPVKHINAITIWDFAGPVCGKLHAKYLPLNYRAKVDPPMNVPGLALSPKDAESAAELHGCQR